MSDGFDRIYDKTTPLADAPAFLRRARQVDETWRDVLERCRREREALLEMPRMRLARLFALARRPELLLEGLLRPGELEYLQTLHDGWHPRLRSAVRPAKSAADLARPLSDLARSFARFNRRWMTRVNEIDFSRVNSLREQYNLYYVLEKECAVRSARVALQGFAPKPPATVADVLAAFPLLMAIEGADSL